MGRGRGKGRKLTVVTHEDAASGEEDKVPVHKRRGRPQKPLKAGNDGHEIVKIEDEDSDSKGADFSGKETYHKDEAENGKRRKRGSQVKGKRSPVKEEIGADTKPSSGGGSSTPSGFRHSGSRRKSTPRRAAEAGVVIDIFFSIDY